MRRWTGRQAADRMPATVADIELGLDKKDTRNLKGNDRLRAARGHGELRPREMSAAFMRTL